MEFEIKSFKVDMLMNSSSINKGRNIQWNSKANQKENQGFGILAGEKNAVSHSNNTVKSQNETDEQTSS
ncbi:hypothetical protein M3936_03245 [Sutcliffiella horikoshii]|uniref:hypothetical protein n=1 Tax=Sutcliffiella horikoshii TaxID=79883 RepID=UPI0020417EC2|nr:hypothetical protein [Sutcliffiella horikoshii]MCM3616591.1 hypothetical protein [Sutcliffiella horikoshii]